MNFVLTAIVRHDEHVFARLEVREGVDVANCGTFTIRNLDFDLLAALLVLGSRRSGVVGVEINDLNRDRILEEG